MARCRCISLVVLFLVTPAIAQSVEGQDGPVCQFCTTPQADQNYFCTHCARLFRIESLQPSNRFWGDAFYIFNLPTLTSRPKLVAEINATGLVRESATFGIGDRYEFTASGQHSKRGKVTPSTATGEIHAWGTPKAVDYLASIEDVYDEQGKLVRRELRGEVRAKPMVDARHHPLLHHQRLKGH